GLIVPLIAILFFCVLLFIRGRAFLSHGERQYLFLSAVFVNIFLMWIIVSASSSPIAGLGVLLSVGATLLLTVALASHEKYAALYNGPRKLDTKLRRFKLHLSHGTITETVLTQFQNKGSSRDAQRDQERFRTGVR